VGLAGVFEWMFYSGRWLSWALRLRGLEP
jgi:hypothetical protein